MHLYEEKIRQSTTQKQIKTYKEKDIELTLKRTSIQRLLTRTH